MGALSSKGREQLEGQSFLETEAEERRELGCYSELLESAVAVATAGASHISVNTLFLSQFAFGEMAACNSE